MAHNVERHKKVEFLGGFKSIFEIALDRESGDQLGTFGEITLDKKISRYCPFNHNRQYKKVVIHVNYLQIKLY